MRTKKIELPDWMQFQQDEAVNGRPGNCNFTFAAEGRASLTILLLTNSAAAAAELAHVIEQAKMAMSHERSRNPLSAENYKAWSTKLDDAPTREVEIQLAQVS